MRGTPKPNRVGRITAMHPHRAARRFAAVLVLWAAVQASSAAAAEIVLDVDAWNPTNTTTRVQAAFTAPVSRVVLRPAPGPWIVLPLVVAGDREIVIERGAVLEAMRGAFHGPGDSLLTLRAVSNVTLTGGGTLRMWPEDYAGPTYRPSEWRHTVRLHGAVNVRIDTLRIERSGGDGLYVGAGPSREPSRNIVVRDVVFDRHHRQGISVITVDDLLLERVVMQGTCGTAPRSGLDVEPNHPWEQVTGVRILDCVSADNHGAGFQFHLANLHATSTPVAIRLERCRAHGNRRAAFEWTGARDRGPTRGEIIVSDCELRSGTVSPIDIRNCGAGALSLVFRRVNVESGAARQPPVVLRSQQGFIHPLGGIQMEDVQVRLPDRETPPAAVRYESALPRLDRLGGHLHVVEPPEERRTDPFTAARLREWQPELTFADLPPLAIRSTECPPARELRSVRWRLRHDAEALLWPDADGVGEVAIEIGRSGQADRIEARAIGADGRTVLATNLSPSASVIWQFGPHGSPPWRLKLHGNTAAISLSNRRGNLRLCADSVVHLFGWEGAFALRVPPHSDQWAIVVMGSEPDEAVRAELTDRAGRVLGAADNIIRPVVLRGRPVEDGIVQLRCSRPSVGRLEDYSVTLSGCAPWLDPAPLSGGSGTERRPEAHR